MKRTEEKFALIEGHNIRYQVSGEGPLVVLLVHGAVGSIRDFELQVEGQFALDRDQFTLVAFDLPGQGKSLPVGAEKRQEELEFSALPSMEYFELAAAVGAKLMSSLGHKTYSVAGWSDGARVASLLAVRHQSRVNALLLWAFVPLLDKHSCEAISRTRLTETWDQGALEAYTSVYGQEQFSELWKNYVDFMVSSLELPEQFDLRPLLSQIKCPTLILHGKEDPIVSFREHVRPLEMKIYDSEIVQLDGLAHNLHQASPQQFNAILSAFVGSNA